jgi:hypothetical protein
MWYHCLGHEEWCSHIDVEYGGVVFCGGFRYGLTRKNTSIVHEDVDVWTESFEGGCYDFVWCVNLGEVGLDDFGIAAVV